MAIQGQPGQPDRRALVRAAATVWIAASVVLLGLHPAVTAIVRPSKTQDLVGVAALRRRIARTTSSASSRTPAPKKVGSRPSSEPQRAVAKKPAFPDPGTDAHHVPVPVKRLTPRVLAERHHDYPAWDISLPHGTRVFAVEAGRVKDRTRWGACGKGIVIRSKTGYTYTYCHGGKLLVKRGRWVHPGREIMRSGNTGNSSGPHLHLQIAGPRGFLLCPQPLLESWAEGDEMWPSETTTRGCHTGHHHHKRGRKTKFGRNENKPNKDQRKKDKHNKNQRDKDDDSKKSGQKRSKNERSNSRRKGEDKPRSKAGRKDQKGRPARHKRSRDKDRDDSRRRAERRTDSERRTSDRSERERELEEVESGGFEASGETLIG